MDKWFHLTLYNRCDYLFMLGLKLIHVSKRVHGSAAKLSWQIKYHSKWTILHLYINASPDLNLTPLAAFLRFLPRCARQKRKKAARGVRFKSGLYKYYVAINEDLPLNSFFPGQNGHTFPDSIFNCIFLNENVWSWLRFHQNLFLRIQLTISRHWFR